LLGGEATLTSSVVIGFILPDIESMIFRSRDEYCNHYTTVKEIKRSC